MDFRKIFRLPKSIFLTALFITRNIWEARHIPVISKGIYNDVEFCPCTKDFAGLITRLYPEFHQGGGLGAGKRVLLTFVGEKLCLVVRDAKTQKIVGYSLYYLNKRDCQEGTVHEGDTEIVLEYRGRGIGTAQRLHALKHFARCSSIKGVSSRVSLNNLASLKSNLNLGFKELERYFDPVMGEERVYLVCDLSNYRRSRTKKK